MADRRSEAMPPADEDLIAGLSETLRPIYELELRLGNRVVRVDEQAWTECPLSIVFERPLHVEEIAKELELPSSVVRWDCDDPHYELQSGYYCETSRHGLAGPRRQSATNAEG